MIKTRVYLSAAKAAGMAAGEMATAVDKVAAAPEAGGVMGDESF